MGGEESKGETDNKDDKKTTANDISKLDEDIQEDLTSKDLHDRFLKLIGDNIELYQKELSRRIDDSELNRTKNERDLKRMIKKGENKSIQRAQATKKLQEDLIMDRLKHSQTMQQQMEQAKKSRKGYNGLYKFIIIIHETFNLLKLKEIPIYDEALDEKTPKGNLPSVILDETEKLSVNLENVEFVLECFEQRFKKVDLVLKGLIEKSSKAIEDNIDDARADEEIDLITEVEGKNQPKSKEPLVVLEIKVNDKMLESSIEKIFNSKVN